MSKRVCSSCDFVIDNRIHQEHNCPTCGSSEMVDPLTDDRDWETLYLKQELEFYKKACIELIEKLKRKNND